MYAPYTDTTLYPVLDISGVSDADSFSLGFIVADGNKNPSWGGYYSVGSDYYKDIIHKCHEKGKKLICSFGGADGRELATVEKDAYILYEKYKKVIDTYGFDHIDFDIEGGALGDTEATKRRAYAIEDLKHTFPNLHVSLTVPVMPYGLDQDAMNVVKATPCDLVNIMAMDYGSIGKGDMGRAACDAALNTRQQTGKPIGITPMIGKNDTAYEIFDIGDAYTVKDFQSNCDWVKRLSIWSIERDRGVKGDMTQSSQIDQKPYEFSKIFK